MSKHIRSLTVEARVIDEKAGLVDYVASDESIDCYREIIRASGWRFTNFAKNAPFVDSHSYYSIDKLLGKVTDFRVQGKQLIERVQWAVDVPEQKLAQLGWKLTVAGYLKAVSVGFFPTRQASKWGDEKAFAEACKELGLSMEVAAMTNCIFLEQEQIELSACIIGANPNALAKAHTDGAVADADLAHVGFSDADMEMLHLAAKRWPDMTPHGRSFIDAQLRSIPFRKEQSKHHAPPADGLDAAEGAQHREQAEFLRKFSKAIQS